MFQCLTEFIYLTFCLDSCKNRFLCLSVPAILLYFHSCNCIVFSLQVWRSALRVFVCDSWDFLKNNTISTRRPSWPAFFTHSTIKGILNCATWAGSCLYGHAKLIEWPVLLFGVANSHLILTLSDVFAFGRRRPPMFTNFLLFTQLRPNSITLSGPKMVADLQRLGIWPII